MTLDEALAKLGSTESEVAQTLTNGGWKGVPVKACDCPIAVYLRAMGFGGAIVDPAVIIDDDGEETTVPAPVSEFIIAFDDGRYLHLVSESPLGWPEAPPAPESAS